MTFVGCSAQGFAPVEGALGGKLDTIRDYGTLDNLPGLKEHWSDWTAAGYGLYASCKFRTAAGFVPAATITSGDHDAQLTAYATLMTGLEPSRDGIKPTLVPDHEADAKAAAAGGSYADICAAILHAFGVARKTPSFATNARLGLSLTGFDLADREAAFQAAIDAADVVMLDPYQMSKSLPFKSFDDIAGPEVDFINRVAPGKPIILGEVGCQPDPTGGTARAEYINGMFASLTTARYRNVESVDWWNNTDTTNGLTPLTPAELSAFAAGVRQLRATPAAVPTVTMPAAQWQAIADAYTKASAALDGATAALDDLMAAIEGAHTT